MFANMKIGKRLGLGFGLLVLFMVALTWIGVKGMASVSDNMERIVKVNMARIDMVNDMNMDIANIGINVRNILYNNDPAKRQEYNQRITKFREQYGEAFKKVEEMTTKTDAKAWEIINKLKEALGHYRDINAKVVELAIANKDAEANQLMSKEGGPAGRTVEELIENLLQHNMERNKTRYEEAVATFKSSR